MSKTKQILIAFFVPLILAGLTFIIGESYFNYRKTHDFPFGDHYAPIGGEIFGLMFWSFILLSLVLPIFILIKRKSIKRTEIKLND